MGGCGARRSKGWVGVGSGRARQRLAQLPRGGFVGSVWLASGWESTALRSPSGSCLPSLRLRWGSSAASPGGCSARCGPGASGGSGCSSASCCSTAAWGAAATLVVTVRRKPGGGCGQGQRAVLREVGLGTSRLGTSEENNVFGE